MLSIRLMGINDIDEVYEIEKATFSLPWSRDSIEKEIENKNAIYLVAENNNEVIGYAGMWHIINEGHITNIAVKQEYRGQGIGEQLVTELIQFGKKDGIESFTLEVRKSNVPAISLYSKMGFKNLGTRKNYYEKPIEDGIIMWLYL